MKLYLKQKVFSWGDKFTVFDADGNDKYYVEGEVFSFGKKLHVYDLNKNEKVFIHQKLFSFMPTYYINIGGRDVAEVKKQFTWFSPRYEVSNFGWHIQGDFWDHDYEITFGDKKVAGIYKEWMSWGDAYAIDFPDGVRELDVLAVALIIDAVISEERRND